MVLQVLLALPVRLGRLVLKETLDPLDHKGRMEILGALAQLDHLAHRVTQDPTALRVSQGYRDRLAAQGQLVLLEISDLLVIQVQTVRQAPRDKLDQLGLQDLVELPELTDHKERLDLSDQGVIQEPPVQPEYQGLQAPMHQLVIRAVQVHQVHQEEPASRVPWGQLESRDRLDLPDQLVLWDLQDSLDQMEQLGEQGPVGLRGRRDRKERQEPPEGQDHPAHRALLATLADQGQVVNRVLQDPLEIPEL